MAVFYAFLIALVHALRETPFLWAGAIGAAIVLYRRGPISLAVGLAVAALIVDMIIFVRPDFSVRDHVWVTAFVLLVYLVMVAVAVLFAVAIRDRKS